MFSLVFLCYKVPCLAPLLSGAGLVLASDFQRTLAFSLQTIPSFLPKAGAKVQLFPLRTTFFSIILKLFFITLFINILQTHFFQIINVFWINYGCFYPKMSIFRQGSLQKRHNY